MSFDLRDVQEGDLPEIFRWFEKRAWPLPPIESVAPGYGVIAEKGATIFACVFVYLTGRSVAFLEWTGTNPDEPEELTMTALDAILDSYKTMCKFSEPKIRSLTFLTKSDALANHFKKQGFKKTEGYFKLQWNLKE